MNRRLDQVGKILTAREVAFIPFDDEENLKISCRGKNGEWPCIVSVPDDAEMIKVFSIIPFSVPAYRQNAVLRFLAMANGEQVGSHFHLNLQTGTVCGKAEQFVGEGDIKEEFLIWMIDSTLLATDCFLPGLIRVIGSDISPAKAFADHQKGRKARAISSLN